MPRAFPFSSDGPAFPLPNVCTQKFCPLKTDISCSLPLLSCSVKLPSLSAASLLMLSASHVASLPLLVFRGQTLASAPVGLSPFLVFLCINESLKHAHTRTRVLVCARVEHKYKIWIALSLARTHTQGESSFLKYSFLNLKINPSVI